MKPSHQVASVQPTPEQLDLLRHMLGINTPRQRVPSPYRNYAAVSPNDPQYVAMATAGWVERYRTAQTDRDFDYYRCTEAGRSAALTSYKSIRWPKSKRLYSQFLSLRDAIPDLTFKEWITSAAFAQMRKDA